MALLIWAVWDTNSAQEDKRGPLGERGAFFLVQYRSMPFTIVGVVQTIQGLLTRFKPLGAFLFTETNHFSDIERIDRFEPPPTRRVFLPEISYFYSLPNLKLANEKNLPILEHATHCSSI